jgi:hypothetical protein
MQEFSNIKGKYNNYANQCSCYVSHIVKIVLIIAEQAKFFLCIFALYYLEIEDYVGLKLKAGQGSTE